eukprot:gene22175-34273_t
MWTLLLLSFASVTSLALTAPLDRTVRVVPCTKTSGVDMMWKLLPQMDPSTFKVVVNASGSNATMLCLDCGDCNVNTIPKLLPCSSSSRTQPQSKSSSQLWVLKNSTAGPRYSCDRSDPTKGPQCVPAESGSYSASQCNEVCTNPTRLTLPAVRPAPAPAAVVLQSLAATPPSKTCIAVGGSDYTLGPTVTMVECDQPTTSNAPDYQQRQAWSFVPSPPSLLSSPSSMGAIRSDGGGCCGFTFGVHKNKPACHETPSCENSPRTSSDTASPTAVHIDLSKVAPSPTTCGNTVAQPVLFSVGDNGTVAPHPLLTAWRASPKIKLGIPLEQ